MEPNSPLEIRKSSTTFDNSSNGSPVFFYYPPLPFFIGSFFYFLSPLDAFGYHQIAATSFLAILFSGIACYLWLRQETDSQRALAGSLIYLSAPFHIAHTFYFIGLLGTLWSYAWFPVIMYYARELARDKPYSVAGLAASLCCLLLSNIPSTVMIGPAAVAYFVFHVPLPRWRGAILNLMAGIFLGFGLAAFFLLPAVMYLHYVDLDLQWLNPALQLDNHFAFVRMWREDQKIYTFAWLAVLGIILVLYLAAPRRNRIAAFYLSATLASLIMMLPISRMLWAHLSALQLLQHPSRMFMISSLFIGALFAHSTVRLRAGYVLVLLSVGVAFVTAWDSRIDEETFDSGIDQAAEAYKNNIDQYAFYLPGRDLIPLFYTTGGFAAVDNQKRPVQLLEGRVVVALVEWQPRHIELKVEVKSPTATLRVRQFYFPGYVASDNGAELRLMRDDATGDIVYALPQGEHTVVLRLTQMVPEILGKFISLLSAIAVVTGVLIRHRDRAGQVERHGRTSDPI
jgi:hypothetical protein